MSTAPTAKLVIESIGHGVVVLSWPNQAAEREHLGRSAVPTLWLVERGIDPPAGCTCLEDWVRLPADDADLRTRLASLAGRAAHHPSVPALDAHGQLTHHAMVVILSPVEQRIATSLIENFGNAVAEGELIGAAWHEGGSEDTLRVHISRLRRRLAPIGLTITSIRSFGYVMRNDT
jgi:two-component system, OmpR family, response regulator